MALFHLATITPTKSELIAEWAPTQPWGPPADVPIDVIGSYRFDDPDGRVGMETHLVNAGGTLLQVPLTYRDEPLDGAADALITEMQHSVLGTRWVYDGLRDPRFVVMLAAVAMTGQGEALGMAVYDGRWYVAPSNVRIEGGGWTQERVPVDGFELVIRQPDRRRSPQRPIRADVLPAPASRTTPRHRAHCDVGRPTSGCRARRDPRENKLTRGWPSRWANSCHPPGHGIEDCCYVVTIS